MIGNRLEQLLVAGALAYLVGLSWAISNTSFDIWGALVVAPPLGLFGVWLMRRLFEGESHVVMRVMQWGLLVKAGGTLARYWVGFEAYGGGIDAANYHRFGLTASAAVRSGEASIFSLIPHTSGTQFLMKVVGLVYTVTGATQLGGFLIFAFLGYVGTAFFVKAGLVAVPGLATTRYAVLCALAPSLVYWPSSIGKETWMMLTLGIGTFGVARLFARQGLVIPLAIAGVGYAGAAFLRPHIAALWLAGILPALLVVFFRGKGHGARQGGGFDRLVVAGVIVLTALSLSTVSQATLRYLNFTDDSATGTEAVSSIIQETTRRTAQAGSSFVPPPVDSPRDWPYASVRTLTRPLIYEARNVQQLLAAAEITLYLGLLAFSWSRVKHLPRMIVTNPFVAFAMATLFLSGLAYSSFANMGVLTRQKVLVFPLLLLIPCLPPKPWKRRRDREGRDDWGERRTTGPEDVLADRTAELERFVAVGDPVGERLSVGRDPASGPR